MTDTLLKIIDKAMTNTKYCASPQIIDKGDYGIQVNHIPREIKEAYLSALAAKDTATADHLKNVINDLTVVWPKAEDGLYSLGFPLHFLKNIEDNEG